MLIPCASFGSQEAAQHSDRHCPRRREQGCSARDGRRRRLIRPPSAPTERPGICRGVFVSTNKAPRSLDRLNRRHVLRRLRRELGLASAGFGGAAAGASACFGGGAGAATAGGGLGLGPGSRWSPSRDRARRGLRTRLRSHRNRLGGLRHRGRRPRARTGGGGKPRSS